MQLQAGHPQQKGSRRDIKALRDRETMIVAQAERSYERFVAQWKPRRPNEARGRLSSAGHK
jgi:transposase